MALTAYVTTKGEREFRRFRDRIKEKLDPEEEEVLNVPTTLTEQGSFVPHLIGRRRLGSVFLWAGERYTQQESSGAGGSGGGFFGGKGGGGSRGGGGSSRTVYYESAWHGLCVGPASGLYRIYQAGEVIFESFPPLTPGTHPSGTVVQVPDDGQFTIFWGEEDQPVNTFLGSNSNASFGNFPRVGVTSRWPFLCYVVWEGKKLGGSPRWPLLDYEIEVNVQDEGPSPLVNTTPQLAGTSYPDGGLGQNGAHILSQLLFGTFPYGLSLDPDHFDKPSLEDLGTLMETELTMLSQLAENGEATANSIADLMKSLGVMLSWDLALDKFVFKEIREQSTNIPVLPADMILPPLPEIEVSHQYRQADRVTYSWPDLDRQYRRSVIPLDNDGFALQEQQRRTVKVGISNVIDQASASVIAERMSQESLVSGRSYQISTNRDTCFLYPGRVFYASGIQPLLRVVDLQLDPNTDLVRIGAVDDYYGVPLSTYTGEQTVDGFPSIARPAGQDDQFFPHEVPGMLTGGGQIRIVVPRIRAHAQIANSEIHGSPDDTTYYSEGVENDLQTGGELDFGEQILDTDPYIIEDGPNVFFLGPPDDFIVQDLTADELSWRAGRQVAVINDEIFFLRNISAVGGGVYQLHGLIRARYDTLPATHAPLSKVYIFDFDKILDWTDTFLAPDDDLFVKSQPFARGGQVTLASVGSQSRTLYGKGIRPVRPGNLRVVQPVRLVPAYGTGEDVTFAWHYTTNDALNTQSGAGFQGAGQPVVKKAPDGFFRMRFKTLGDVVVRTFDTQHWTLANIDIPTPVGELPPVITYFNADIIADLGSEVSFKAELVEVANGYESDPIEITVTKI